MLKLQCLENKNFKETAVYSEALSERKAGAGAESQKRRKSGLAECFQSATHGPKKKGNLRPNCDLVGDSGLSICHHVGQSLRQLRGGGDHCCWVYVSWLPLKESRWVKIRFSLIVMKRAQETYNNKSLTAHISRTSLLDTVQSTVGL